MTVICQEVMSVPASDNNCQEIMIVADSDNNLLGGYDCSRQ